MSITTADLSEFGIVELLRASMLLQAAAESGYPVDFDRTNIKLMFDKNSGHVFFTNEDQQIAEIGAGNQLQSYYSCPECGHGGFYEEMEHGEDNEECQEYLAEIKKNRE